jgi:uncharacterized protein involved in exopolysaccharide biosynthesis
MNVVAESPRTEEVVDLRAMWQIVLAGRWWVLTSVAIFTAVFVAVALLGTPVYRVSAVMIPATNERNTLNASLSSALGTLGGLAGFSGLTGTPNDSDTEEALAVLRSRQFTESFITDEKLMPKLFPNKWDEARGHWSVPEEEVPTLARTYKYFDRKIRSVSRDKKSGLVTLQIEFRDRHEAARWANELMRRLNAEMRARAIANADASLGFLENELKSTSVVEMREAINRLIEAQIRQRMLANVTEEYAFRVVDAALPPDADDPVRPRKVLMSAAGPAVGLIVGVVLVLAMAMMRPVAHGPRV